MLINTISNINKDSLKGKIIAFPTDTVFGVGAVIDDLEAIDKIYKLKNRSLDKPLSILAANIEDILPYIKKINNDVFLIMKKYWPGALTIIFEKSEVVNQKVTKGFKTIAFRIPNSKLALKLLNQTGPLATTSVNISGEKPLNNYQEICQNFNDEIDYIVRKNETSSNISSTIIDATEDKIKIIRQGQIKIT